MIYLSDNDILQTLTASVAGKKLLVRLFVEDLHFGPFYTKIAEFVRVTDAAANTQLNLSDTLGRYLRREAAEDLPDWKTSLVASYRKAQRRWYLAWAELNDAGAPGSFTIEEAHTVVLGGLPKLLEAKIPSPIESYLPTQQKWHTWAPDGARLSRVGFDHVYLPIRITNTGEWTLRMTFYNGATVVDTVTQLHLLTIDRFVRFPLKDVDFPTAAWDRLFVELLTPEPSVYATRTFYRVDELIRPQRHVIYRNSLGFYDLMEITGDLSQTVTRDRDTAERGGWGINLPQGERYVWQNQGARVGVLRTGYISKANYLHLMELMASEEVYLIDEETEQYLPIEILAKSLPLPTDFQTVYSEDVPFAYLFTEKKYGVWS